MIATRNAALYARISPDPNGMGLGVQRQLTDSRKKSDADGYVVVGEYVDHDVKPFPARISPSTSECLAISRRDSSTQSASGTSTGYTDESLS